MREWLAVLGLVGLLLLAGVAVRCNDVDEAPSAAKIPEATPKKPVTPIEKPIALATPRATRTPAPSPTPTPPPEVEFIPSESSFLPDTTPEPAETATPTPLPPPMWPLRVQVTEKDGRTVAGAEITAVWHEGGAARRSSGRTNSSGLFNGESLATPRIESISATADGFSPQTIQEVSLENGVVRIELNRLPYLSGTALRANGSPLEGPFTAIVFLDSSGKQARPANSLSLSPERMKPVAVKRFSRTGGKFIFERLAPGDYFVAIWSEALLGGGSTRATLVANLPSPFLRILTFSSLSISGRAVVRNADGSETPAAGVEIKAANRGAALAGSEFSPGKATTDSEGAFVMKGLPGGLYSVEASGGSANVESAIRHDYPLRSSDSEPVDFVLNPKSIRLAGAVYGDGGKGLSGASILLVRGGPGAVQRKTVSDSKGQFSFADLSQGTYRLGVAHPDDAGRQKLIRVLLDEGGAAAPVAIRFHPRKRVSGRVTKRGLPAGVGFLEFLWKEDLDMALEGGPILVPVDPKTGRYEAFLEPGLYLVSAGGVAGETLVVQSDLIHDFEVK